MTDTTGDTGTLFRLDEDARAALFTDAHTANSFSDTPVSDDELREIWDLAKWAPTMANVQPLRVLYVTTPAARATLVEHMSDGNKAKTLAAPAVAVLALDNRFHDFIPTVMPFKPEMKDMFEENEGMRSHVALFNSALQAGYFTLAVRAQGLAAGPMGGFDADAVDAEFFPGGRFHAVLVVNIGHPADDAFRPRLPRLDHADAIQWA